MRRRAKQFDVYDQITAPADDGTAQFRRVRDGRVVLVKAGWFKPAPDGNGLIPASRVKAIRIDGMKYEVTE